jgi:hypothetical protein
MSTDFEQASDEPTELSDRPASRAEVQGTLTLGPLGTLNQVTKALGKVLRAMASGKIDSQHGSRLCNGLGIMRACLETATLERIERRLDEMEGIGGRTYGDTSSDRAVVRPH